MTATVTAAPRTTMLPDPVDLPDVLPTERLTVSGMPVRRVRDDLRRIADVRNVGSVVLTIGQAAATIGLALHSHHVLGWAAAFLLMGPAYTRFAILGHEAAHKLLFTNKRANDLVGRWLISYPGWVAFEAYRRSHFAHHREEFGPEEPDLNLYQGYPIRADSFWRKLKRDAFGSSGVKNLKGLLSALRSPQGGAVARRILAAQLVLFGLMTAWGVAAAGWLGLLTYPVLWFGPWMTVWRVLNRLRSIAEHGGCTASKDRRLTTHHVRQSLLARFVIVPFNTGWHLAHHVDMGVPWRNLPRLHRELVDAGWVTEGYTYPSYRALWSALRSG